MSKDFYSASELADLGYVSERLTSVFGEPDSVDGELRWDADTVDAVERDVLAPAARIMFDAFAPERGPDKRIEPPNTSGRPRQCPIQALSGTLLAAGAPRRSLCPYP
ncbi:MAG: hypothetical protein ACRDTW_21260 [Rhodococcus qingshengii]|uniref:hypothetical protein n=1 Tax=Rhodococcus sp. 27YEA6 TaxID=3156273 RepID=UPI003837CC3D